MKPHFYNAHHSPIGAFCTLTLGQKGARGGLGVELAGPANEPLHIQYSYDSNAIVLVNHALDDAHGLQASIRVRNLDGSVRYEKHLRGIDLAGNHAQQVATLPTMAGLSPTYFVELDLASADGRPVSRNVYWLSTRADKLDWDHSNWYLTPLTQYADLTALKSLPAATRLPSSATSVAVNDGDVAELRSMSQ